MYKFDTVMATRLNHECLKYPLNVLYVKLSTPINYFKDLSLAKMRNEIIDGHKVDDYFDTLTKIATILYEQKEYNFVYSIDDGTELVWNFLILPTLAKSLIDRYKFENRIERFASGYQYEYDDRRIW